MRDRIRIAMEDSRKADRTALYDEIYRVNSIVKEASKIDNLLSEDGWKTLTDLFTSIWRKSEIEIRRDPKKREEAIAMQNALSGLHGLIRSIQSNRVAQEERLALLVEQRKEIEEIDQNFNEES
jgi:hypothetical protein